MNIVTAALISVSALWSILGVNALQCYSCTNMKNNTECNKQPKETCTSSSSCFTMVEKIILTDVKITKRCAQGTECDSTDYNAGIASKKTSCCHENLCNEAANGKTTINSNAFLILSAVLALCLFKNI